MFSVRSYPRVLLAGATLAFALATGCGDDGDPAVPPSASGGSGGEAGGTGTGTTDVPEAGAPNEGSGGRTDEGSGGTTSEEQGGGTSVEQGGEGPGTSTPPAPEFEGVDLDDVELEPSPGCSGGFDPDTGSINLAIEGTGGTLLIDADGGYLRANGRICTAADGTEVRIDDVLQLGVDGTDGDDTLILDALPGPLGEALLATAGSIQADLGDGEDAFILRGSREDDRLTCSAGTGVRENILDLGGGVEAFSLRNAESLIASLGPGDDWFGGYVETKPCTLPMKLYAGADSDSLQGGSGDDELNGGEGTDEFDMGAGADGADVINGGGGEDLVSYGRRTLPLTVTLCTAPDELACAPSTCGCEANNGQDTEGDTIVNVEDADGGDGADVITGDEGPNVLSGKGGADRINGLGDVDQIYGDLGDDTLNGGAGDDIITGGSGTNTVDAGGGDDICLFAKADKKPLNCETPIPQ